MGAHKYQFLDAPRNDEELYYFVKGMWGHTIPRHKVCPDHDAPFDAFAAAYFAREPQILIHGSRGLAGKSRLLSILGLTEAAVLGADVNLLGGSLAQSQNIHDTMRDAWEYKNAPRYMLTTDPTAGKIVLSNKAKIRPLTASQRTVRGPHPPRLLLDEIDEMDEKILEGALGQPMPQTNWLGEEIAAQTVFSSTWQYPDKTMAHQMERFRENDLPIFTWCMKDTSNPIDGWLSPDFIEQKKREIPAEMWRIEYELGEPSIGSRAFDSDAVEKMFSEEMPAPEDCIIYKKAKDYEEYQFETYNHFDEYVIGADWAKEMDFTVFTVYKCTKLPVEVVYQVRMRRRPYPVMIEHFNKMSRVFHAEMIHDRTGLGNVVADYVDSMAYGFIMSGQKRDDMLSNYVNAVEKGNVKCPRIMTTYKNHLYASVEALYARGKEFHLPDDICSMALAWHLVSRRVGAVGPTVLEELNDANYIEREIRENREGNQRSQKKSQWNVGHVVDKTQQDSGSTSLMV